MVRAADQRDGTQSSCGGRRGDRLDDGGRALTRRVSVYRLDDDRNATPGGNLVARPSNRCERRIASGSVDVPHIHAQSCPAGNTVDGAGEYVADADGADTVYRTGRARGCFDGKRDFGSGEERIATLWHEHRAGMTAFAFNVDTQAGGRGNRGDDADIEAARFQDRTLFDVKFDERGIASLR